MFSFFSFPTFVASFGIPFIKFCQKYTHAVVLQLCRRSRDQTKKGRDSKNGLSGIGLESKRAKHEEFAALGIGEGV